MRESGADKPRRAGTRAKWKDKQVAKTFRRDDGDDRFVLARHDFQLDFYEQKSIKLYGWYASMGRDEVPSDMCGNRNGEMTDRNRLNRVNRRRSPDAYWCLERECDFRAVSSHGSTISIINAKSSDGERRARAAIGVAPVVDGAWLVGHITSTSCALLDHRLPPFKLSPVPLKNLHLLLIYSYIFDLNPRACFSLTILPGTDRVPRGHWLDQRAHREFLDSLRSELNIVQPLEWKKLSQKHIMDAGAGALLTSTSSLRHTVVSSRPLMRPLRSLLQ